MIRADLITELKRLLDSRDLGRVLELAGQCKAEHPVVCERALAACLRLLGDKQTALPLPPQPPPVPAPRPVAFKPGFYTAVMIGDGHVTFKVEKQGEDAVFAPGAMIVSRLVGPNNDNAQDYHGVAFAKADGRIITWKKYRDDARLATALQILSKDPKAAGLGYAKASGRCYLCGRLLTTPESIEAGVGPVCAQKE